MATAFHLVKLFIGVGVAVRHMSSILAAKDSMNAGMKAAVSLSKFFRLTSEKGTRWFLTVPLVGGVVNYLAWNCQSSTSGGPYSGGSCHWYDDASIGKFLFQCCTV